LPILSQSGQVISIIDAESFATGTFTPERLLKLSAVAEELAQVLEQL